MNRFNGFIRRRLLLSSFCSSSSFTYCCKDDLCNNLLSIPLPSLNSLLCYVSRCSLDDNDQCLYSTRLVSRSNVLQSCSSHQEDYGDYLTKSFDENCSPGRIALSSSIRSGSRSIEQTSCCYSSKCNEKTSLSSRVSRRCFVCDSRIFGLKGCQQIDSTDSHLYQRETSNPSESCVTIVGFEGFDRERNVTYSSFVLRTFLSDCLDQSIGSISFGGMHFQGFIRCCSTDFCNQFDVQFVTSSSPTSPTSPTSPSSSSTIEITTEQMRNSSRILSIRNPSRRIPIFFFVFSLFLLSFLFFVFIRRKRMKKRFQIDDIPLCLVLEPNSIPFSSK